MNQDKFDSIVTSIWTHKNLWSVHLKADSLVHISGSKELDEAGIYCYVTFPRYYTLQRRWGNHETTKTELFDILDECIDTIYVRVSIHKDLAAWIEEWFQSRTPPYFIFMHEGLTMKLSFINLGRDRHEYNTKNKFIQWYARSKLSERDGDHAIAWRVFRFLFHN